MTFVDEVDVEARAGRGGDGSAAMRSEPYKPKGGPEGGDGGPRRRRRLPRHPQRARPRLVRGPSTSSGRTRQAGRSRPPRRRRTGRTSWWTSPTAPSSSTSRDCSPTSWGRARRPSWPGAAAAAAATLASPVRRTACRRTAEAGEEGEERRLHVELRTVADLGLVGLPNAGKSTLLSRLTAADAEDRRLPVHDAHAEPRRRGGRATTGSSSQTSPAWSRARTRARASAIASCVTSRDAGRSSSSSTSPLRTRRADLDTVRGELRAYDPELAERPSLVVGTKADLVEDPARAADAIRGAGRVVRDRRGPGPAAIAARAAVAPGGRRTASPAPRTWCSDQAVRGSRSRGNGAAGGSSAATSSGGCTRPISTTNARSPPCSGS